MAGCRVRLEAWVAEFALPGLVQDAQCCRYRLELPAKPQRLSFSALKTLALAALDGAGLRDGESGLTLNLASLFLIFQTSSLSIG